MAFKNWIIGEKLLAADLNGNFLSPALLEFEWSDPSSAPQMAFNSTWTRAVGRTATTQFCVYKNTEGNKLDPFLATSYRNDLTSLGSPAYSAWVNSVSKFLVGAGASVYSYNDSDTIAESTITVSGTTLTGILGIAADNTNVYILDNLGYVAGTGTATYAAGSTTVMGTGTLFTTEFEVGDEIRIGGGSTNVIAIASNTSLTASGSTGSTFTGSPNRRNIALKKFTIAGGTLTYVSQVVFPFRHSFIGTLAADANYIYSYGTAIAGDLIAPKIRKFNKTTGALVSTFNLLGITVTGRNNIGVTVDPEGNARLLQRLNVTPSIIYASRIKL